MNEANEIQQQILKDSATLIVKTAAALEVAKQVPALEKKASDLEAEVVALKKEAADRNEVVRGDAIKMAERLEVRGLLPREKKAEFVDAIVANPAGALDVLDKVSGVLSAPSVGMADEKVASLEDSQDPIVKFAMS
jgi:hypothetical protein